MKNSPDLDPPNVEILAGSELQPIHPETAHMEPVEVHKHANVPSY